MSGEWRADPTGRHGERWFEAGAPTGRVRDRGVENVDAAGLAAVAPAGGADRGPGPGAPPLPSSGPDPTWVHPPPTSWAVPAAASAAAPGAAPAVGPLPSPPAPSGTGPWSPAGSTPPVSFVPPAPVAAGPPTAPVAPVAGPPLAPPVGPPHGGSGVPAVAPVAAAAAGRGLRAGVVVLALLVGLAVVAGVVVVVLRSGGPGGLVEPARSEERFCDTLTSEQERILAKFEASSSAMDAETASFEDVVVGLAAITEAIGELNVYFAKLADVAPEEIRAEAEIVAEKYDELSSSPPTSFDALAGSFMVSLQLQGPITTMNDYARAHCGRGI